MTELTSTDSPGIATNGKGKPDSALTKLLAAVKGTKVNETDKKKTTEAFKKAMGERAKLQAALDAFDAKADETAVNMVKCYGATHVMVDGVRYVPTSRGDRVYYKKMSDQLNVVEL
jgi:hypothetical protein